MEEYVTKDNAINAALDTVELFPSEYEAVECAIQKLPAADVAPVVHGRWVSAHEFMPISKCNICGQRPLFRQGDEVYSNYCPNCGAQMDGKIGKD